MQKTFEIETQKKLNWCWAAVAATVGRYFFPDLALQQCQIANKTLGTDCCTGPLSACDQPENLDKALDALNTLLPKSLTHQKAGPLSFNEVRKQIDSSHPVCATIQWTGEPRAHLVMITGYSISQSKKRWVDVADPYYEDSTVSYTHFRSAYLGAGEWVKTCVVSES